MIFGNLIRTLYSWLMVCLQPLVRRKLQRRAQTEPGYGVAVEERFGVYTQAPSLSSLPPLPSSPVPGAAPLAPLVWVHAVSLGETRASAALVAELRLALPGMRLLLTHGTATGRAQGLSLLTEGDLQVWQPWDTPQAVRRFLTHFRPAVGLLVDTEVWPTMVAKCRSAGVPLCLVNARLNEKSLRQAQHVAWLARPAYAALAAVWAQSDADAQRLRALGAKVQGVLGNFKFDAKPDAAQVALGQRWRNAVGRPVITFAVSREGEEALLLAQLHSLRALRDAEPDAFSRCQWMIVPRHPQRFDEVEKLCRDRGFSVSRRSQWGEAPASADLWLGDTLGEMALYYGLSDVALLGGSFEPLGGQNLIEALACGCPVVMGLHTFNFTEAAALAAAAGAAFQVNGIEGAVTQAMQLALVPQKRQTASVAGLQLAAAHQGAAQRTALAVRALLTP